MLKGERIGYGYNRSDRDFRGHDCNLVVIDTKADKRAGRIDVMQALKEGDTLVIFSWKEFAPGAQKKIMQAELDGMGVTVELLDIPEKPKVKPSARGMSDAAKDEALSMWHKPAFSVDYIQSHLTRKGLGTYSRNQLNYALGPRTPPGETIEEEGE